MAKRGKNLTDEQIAQIRGSKASGGTIAQIAKQLKISEGTVGRYTKPADMMLYKKKMIDKPTQAEPKPVEKPRAAEGLSITWTEKALIITLPKAMILDKLLKSILGS